MTKKHKSVSKALCLATPMLLTLGLSSGAQAAAYAVSSNVVTGFSATLTGTAIPFSFSTSSAALDDTGTGNADILDAPASCIGCNFNNDFTSHGNGGQTYAYGDSQITNTNLAGGAAGASAIGEASTSAGVGIGVGINSIQALLVTNAPGSIGFGFNAKPFMMAQTAGGNEVATSSLNMTITLTDALNNTVFSWAPNGAAGGIIGGIETADAFDLNRGIGQALNPGTAIFDPGTGAFSAATNALATGLYQLNVTMKDSGFVSVSAINVIPLPATVWLLIGGFLGIMGVSRRGAKFSK